MFIIILQLEYIQALNSYFKLIPSMEFSSNQ